MPTESRPRIEVSPEVRERARLAREKLAHRPGLEDVEDPLFFYAELRQATLHNPTWKLLGDYARAVGRNLTLAVSARDSDR